MAHGCVEDAGLDRADVDLAVVISIENRLVVSRVPLPQAPWTGFAAPIRLLMTACESPPITPDGPLVPVGAAELED